MQEIFTAKTMDEIKKLATQKFGVTEENIDFEVLEEPKKSLLFKKGDYKVKATYIAPVMETTTDTQAENVETVESVVETVEQTPMVETVQEVTTNPVSVAMDTPVVENNQQVENVVETSNISDVETSVNVEEIPTPEEIMSKAKVAQEYVSAIIEKMGIDTTSEIIPTENGAVIDFKGDGTGTIIGKRGETLDALQYLSAMICNKGEKGYYRITLDSCGYRAKRKVILQELAKKVSKNVLRTGRSQSLEPMNPYERRIIHATISEIDGVTSRSIGEEPFRKVIISSTNPKKYNNNNRKGGYRGNNRNGNSGGYNKRGGNNRYNNNRNGNNNNNNNNNDRRKNYQPPRSLDLKTSFEKDYRKPKPEDNLKEGLYGKIEF